MLLIVSIPAYNESVTIGRLIGNIHSVMKKNKYNYKIFFF